MSSQLQFAPNGSTWKTVIFTAFFGFFGNFYQAYAVAYTNTAADAFKAFIDDSYAVRGTPLSPTTSIWIWSFTINCFTVGNLIAKIFIPSMTDKLGRKFCVLIGNAGMVIASLLGAISLWMSLPELFIMSRILGGMTTATNSIAWMLILMEAPVTNIRGTCFFVSGTAFAAIQLLGMSLGMKIFLEANVLLLVALGAIPSFITCIMVLAIKESPKYLLINRNDRAAAKEALIYYQGEHIDHDQLMDDVLKESKDTVLGRSSLQILVELFTKPHLRRAIFLGMCTLHAILGVWPITTRLFKDHFTPEMSQIYSTSLFCVNFVAGIIGSFVVSKIKRRSLVVFSSLANILSLLAFVIFDRLAVMVSPVFSYGCLASMFGYNLSYGIGIGVIAFYITGELLPQLHRSTGQAVVFFVTLVISFCFSFVTLPAYEYYTSLAFIPLFIIPGLLCTLYLYFYLPETKGREAHEIVEELRQATSSRNKIHSTSLQRVY